MIARLLVGAGFFFLLHGMVHGLYAGQSSRRFELTRGFTWPDGSWALSRLLGVGGTRILASAAMLVCALGFALAGVGLVFVQDWWLPVVVGAAALSTLAYVLLWNGKLERLSDQGAIGIVINVAIVAVVLLFGWPA